MSTAGEGKTQTPDLGAVADDHSRKRVPPNATDHAQLCVGAPSLAEQFPVTIVQVGGAPTCGLTKVLRNRFPKL